MSRINRIGWLLMAIVFLVSSVGFVAFLVWNELSQKDTPSSQAANKNSDGSKLKGTKLSGYTPLGAKITEIQITDTKVGIGEIVKPGDTITVDYVGALAADGIIFDASSDSGQPFTTKLDGNSVISGWVVGVSGMKFGSQRRIVIPSTQGYGAQGYGSIPPDADLVFDVTLLKIGD